METFSEEAEIKLNELIEKTYDTEKEFLKVSEYLDNPTLKAFFKEKAFERNGYIGDLIEILKLQGMTVTEVEGSISESLQRVWMDAKALFELDDDESILEEVRISEKAAIEDYDDILNTYDLNPAVREVLIKQKTEIQKSSDQADYLEHLK